MANNFEYFAPTKVYFGKGEEKNAGTYIREYGATHVMLVYGGHSAKNPVWLIWLKKLCRRNIFLYPR